MSSTDLRRTGTIPTAEPILLLTECVIRCIESRIAGSYCTSFANCRFANGKKRRILYLVWHCPASEFLQGSGMSNEPKYSGSYLAP